MNSVTQNKDCAVRFLEMVTIGAIDDAYNLYVNMKGIHHNMFFAAGFPMLLAAMKENHVAFPHKRLEIVHMIGEGDMVVVHSRLMPEPHKNEYAITVHIFRFAGGRIVELWDCSQKIPAHIPNTDGPF